MSKIYLFFDWLWKLFILNTLTLVCSLGIVTILPSFSACINTIKDLKEDKEKSVYKMFFVNFKMLFKRSVFIGVISLVLLGLFGYALFYYRVIIGAEEFQLDTLGIISYIGYYFSFFILIVLIIINNQLPLILTYFNFRFRDNFRFAIFIAFRFLLKSIILLIFWAFSLALFVIPALVPFWFFLGLSVPLYCTFMVMRPIYHYLVNNKADIRIEGEK